MQHTTKRALPLFLMLVHNSCYYCSSNKKDEMSIHAHYIHAGLPTASLYATSLGFIAIVVVQATDAFAYFQVELGRFLIYRLHNLMQFL